MASMYQIHLGETLYRFLNAPTTNSRVYFDEIDWEHFVRCLESKKILPVTQKLQDSKQANEKISSAYLPEIRIGKRHNGGIELKWQLEEKTKEDVMEWRHNSKPALLEELFSQAKKEEICLSFCIFCFRRLQYLMPSPFIWICNKKIDITSRFETIKNTLFFEETNPICIFGKFEEKEWKVPSIEEWLSEENGWNISADQKTINHLATNFACYGVKDERVEDRRRFYLKLTRWIFEELERNPYGSYLLGKIKRIPQSPDSQTINFLKAMVKIHISCEGNLPYERVRHYKSFYVAIETNRSFIKAAILPIQSKLRALGEKNEDFSQEDYTRVLFAIARCCRETPDHTTSMLVAKKSIQKFFGTDYTEIDCSTIINILTENEILEVCSKKHVMLRKEDGEVITIDQPTFFRFKNKLFRLYIEGYGSSRYADESIVDSICLQGKNPHQLNHLISYEYLTFFSAAYFEAANDRDQVIRHLLAEANDFDVSKRNLQAPAIHVLSMFLVEYDYLLTGKTRNEVFVSVFGKNGYPHQREFFHTLMQRECYKKQFERARNEALTVNKFGYTKGDSLFFFYELPKGKKDDYSRASSLHNLSWRLPNATELLTSEINNKLEEIFSPDQLAKIKSEAKELGGFLLRDVYLDTEKAQKKLTSAVQTLYAAVLSSIVNFKPDTLKLDGKSQITSDLVRKIYTAEYLLYAFSDIGRFARLPKDKENLNRVATLAVAVDFAKKKINQMYNSEQWTGSNMYHFEQWTGTNMYMTCASARVFSLFDAQNIILDSKVTLSESEKFQYLKWLKNELIIGYESGSLRYTMFMIRLLSHTDMDMTIVRNLILYSDEVNIRDGNVIPSILHSQKRYTKEDEKKAIKDLIRRINHEKRRFKSCFANTKFLYYDAFSSDLNEASVKCGLVFKIKNVLKHIQTDEQEIPFTDEKASLWYTRDEGYTFPDAQLIKIQNAEFLTDARWSDNNTKSRNLLISDIVDDITVEMSAI